MLIRLTKPAVGTKRGNVPFPRGLLHFALDFPGRSNLPQPLPISRIEAIRVSPRHNMIHFPVPEALTFDDVLLLPARSDVIPTQTNTKTQPTRNIRLNIPINTAAMNTVTEPHMAIAVAQQGGIGIIH